MEWYLLGVILVGVLLALLATGLPVAFTMAFVGLVGLFAIRGLEPTLALLQQSAYAVPFNFILVAVPLFVFMAEVIMFTGLGADAFEAASKWLGHLPGGLGISAVYASAAFGAVSGVSIAACVAIGQEAIPQMLRRGYDKRLATGAMAASGGLAILIPPSIVMIIYGYVAEESVGDLFIGGVIPGLILATLMALLISSRVMLKPSLAPRLTAVPWKERLFALRKVWGVVVLALLVLGVIYAGLVTPSEAAAFGAAGAILLAIITRKLSWPRLRGAMLRATETSCFILFIMVGASMFAHVLTTLQIPQDFTRWATSLATSRWVIIILIQLLLIVMGTFLDVASLIIIVGGILVPLIVGLGFDKVWFGVVLTVNMEMAVITPPVGFNLYAIHGISKQHGVTFGDIAIGALPFVITDCVCLALLMAFPQLVLWLPSTMK
ncbi:TRAP transporter large permease [Chloroflexota bacterium]